MFACDKNTSLHVSAHRWVRCNTERIHPKVDYWVTELLKGCEYEFRVSAENEVGAGDPSPPSKPVFAKDPIGEFTFHYTSCYCWCEFSTRILPVLSPSETKSTSEPKGC